jgi:elongation factor G
MGELHLEVIATRLEQEFHLVVRLGKPQVEYRETITHPARAESSYERTIAGRDHYARVDLGLEPLPAGTGNRFGSRTAQPGVDRFRRVIEQAAMSALEGGVIGGYRVLDVGVTLLEVEIREETASEMAFAAATRNAVKDALRAGDPALLEPIMRLEIVTPREFTGGILAGLASRRGKVDSTELKAGRQMITARVPLSQMFGYTTDLRSASQGRATYSMHFDRFDRVDT